MTFYRDINLRIDEYPSIMMVLRVEYKNDLIRISSQTKKRSISVSTVHRPHVTMSVFLSFSFTRFYSFTLKTSATSKLIKLTS